MDVDALVLVVGELAVVAIRSVTKEIACISRISDELKLISFRRFMISGASVGTRRGWRRRRAPASSRPRRGPVEKLASLGR
jgi:hypothetical protein